MKIESSLGMYKEAALRTQSSVFSKVIVLEL